MGTQFCDNVSFWWQLKLPAMLSLWYKVFLVGENLFDRSPFNRRVFDRKKSILPNFFNIDNMKFRVYANLSNHNMNESVLDPCKSLQQPVRGRIGTVCFAIDKRFSSTFFRSNGPFFGRMGLGRMVFRRMGCNRLV